MGDAALLLFRGLASAAALTGFVYILSALAWPRFFDRHFYFGHAPYKPSFLQKVAFYGRFVFLLVAVGYFVWSGAYAIVDVIPYDWGSEYEDGEWQSTRDTLRAFIVFFGTGLVIEAAEKRGKEWRLGNSDE